MILEICFRGFKNSQKENPTKTFYPIEPQMLCADMKKITLEKVIHVLETGANQVEVSEELRSKANAPLDRMLTLAQ